MKHTSRTRGHLMKGIIPASILAGLIILMLAGGCGEDECCTPECPECSGEPDYFPLAVGNWWAFESDTLPSGPGGSAGSTHWWVDTLRVIRRELSPSVVTYIARSHCMWVQPFEGAAEIYRHIGDTMRVEIDGGRMVQVWASHMACPAFLVRKAILHLPVTLGDRWESHPDTSSVGLDCGPYIHGTRADTARVSEHFPSVRTPAGEFEDVYGVECDRGASSNLFWYGVVGPVLYAPDVGPIKYPDTDLVGYSVEGP